MHSKPKNRLPRKFLMKSVVAVLVIAVLAISSYATVTASTVYANVIDGEENYTFSMNSTEVEDMISYAETLGLRPLGSLDVAERVGKTTTVNIRRGIPIQIEESGKSLETKTFKGDTVEKALVYNSIVLKEKDLVEPSRDTVLTESTSIVIKRNCDVNVFADGKKQTVSLSGGTVQEALKQLNVILGVDDTANYPMQELLFDQMNIRVNRLVNITVTADGKTSAHKISADNVKFALEKAKVKVTEHDLLNYKLKDKVFDKMDIVVKRVRFEEAKRTEVVAYKEKDEATDSLFKGETKVKVEGLEGEKEITLKKIYFDNVFEKEEVASEKIIKAPVDKVTLVGTKLKPEEKKPEPTPEPVPEATAKPQSTPQPTGGGNGGSLDGISYSRMISGGATAYSGGGTTATGAPAAVGRVAVNPNVIPYGTRLYITSADGGYVYGYAVASDTGGAAASGSIVVDLYMDTLEECTNFGRRTVNVYILD